ncbi:MAG: rhomboid family intramembrane serine protease, partial [Thermoguttaceae bacterium]|nr:rhomboid family intramembrane serine protease [Thermoguttaceae bacterium]
MFLPLRDDNPTRRTAYATWALIALNVVSFLRVLLLPDLEQQVLYFERGFIPARLSQLDEGEPVPVTLQLQALDRRSGRVVDLQKEILLPPDPRQIALSFLTCMFLHGGWMHLIGNMW